jgi:diguanylate cyclase
MFEKADSWANTEEPTGNRTRKTGYFLIGWLGAMVWIAVLLIIVNLVVGWLLGRRWPTGRRGVPGLARGDARKIREVARRLAEHVATVNRDVQQHQGRVEEVNRDLLAAHSNDQDQPAESVLSAVAEILKINAALQSRLSAAEEKLQGQSKEIQSWMTQARTDSLTGLPNRRSFDDALQRQIAERQRTGTAFSLMIIDADHFKAINDRYGHLVGDSVLRSLAEVLEGRLRRMDTIARIGGEEFAVILPSTAGPNACHAAEHCRLAMASHSFQGEKLRLRLTVSVGVAAADSRDDGTSLLRRADQALYAAKQAGRNCTYFHNGQGCERVDADATPGDVPALPGSQKSELDAQAELTAVCHGLRTSLAEAVHQDA